MFEATSGRLSDALAIRPHAGLTVGVRAGGDEWTVDFGSSGYEVLPGRPDKADLRFSSSADTWAGYFRPVPERGYGTIAGLHRIGVMTIEGDLVVFFRDQLLIEYVFSALRKPRIAESPSPANDGVVFEPIQGRYVRMPIAGRPHRLYIEEAGAGIPLLCLHTAGSDSRQYRALLNDAEITDRFRVIVFDLPWHGKSSPPVGYQDEAYTLTVDQYGAVILAVCDVLQLDRPVVIGCSIGGRMVLELGLRWPKRFRAAIGLQSSPIAEKGRAECFRTLNIARRSDANGPEAAAGRVRPLIGPTAPDDDRWETLWHYMQSGPGVFVGDTDYYFDSGNVTEEQVAKLKSSGFPLFLLAGDYDLGVTPDLSRTFAERVGARHYTLMPGLGHFPMSEDPSRFRQYLLPVLGEVARVP